MDTINLHPKFHSVKEQYYDEFLIFINQKCRNPLSSTKGTQHLLNIELKIFLVICKFFLLYSRAFHRQAVSYSRLNLQ